MLLGPIESECDAGTTARGIRVARRFGFYTTDIKISGLIPVSIEQPAASNLSRPALHAPLAHQTDNGKSS